MRPKAKFLTVVWGETYIERFASLALPSFLAEGNLPALAEATELEVVIMTRHDDIEFFQSAPTFHKLTAICPVRFVEIDDLVTTSVYGVTLTLAYARPIIACGAEMLKTHFVFMNADFVLADGSLRSLGRHIVAGRSIVLGPSFRATAEAVEPVLEAMVDTETGVLAVPARRLAKLSLASPHPTTLAKTLNQNFYHSTQPNQFFWQVDKNTVLGRYYLIFMLCLKPERIIETVNCYCDYSFIPEMCPSGDEAVMGDSDDFFMLELQQRDQEKFLLRLGRARDDVIAASLQSWTTREHRRAAGHDVVFHAGDIPDGIEKAKSEARKFVERIGSRLGRPVPHIGHRYWVHGVAAWRYHRRSQGVTTLPPELAMGRKGIAEWLSISGFKNNIQKLYLHYYYFSHRVIPAWIHKTPLHPYWLDYRHLHEKVAHIRAVNDARVLVVRDKAETVDRFFVADKSVGFTTLRRTLSDGPPRLKQGAYTHALFYLYRKDCRNVQKLIKRCLPAMSPGATYQVFIHNRLGEMEKSNFSAELVHYVEDIVGAAPQGNSCTFVGGTIKRFNAKLLLRLARVYARFGRWSLIWVLPMLPPALLLTLAGNMYLRLRMPSENYVKYCSSAAIEFDSAELASTAAMPQIPLAAPAFESELTGSVNTPPLHESF
jgi:hypothetical protein